MYVHRSEPRQFPTAGRRGAALLVDFFLAAVVVFVMRASTFSGLPAALFSLGVYKAVSETITSCSVGKWITGVKVAKWDFGGGGPWALRCLTRESVLWLLPGLVLLSQAILALVPHGKLEGVALVLVLAMVGLELSLLGVCRFSSA